MERADKSAVNAFASLRDAWAAFRAGRTVAVRGRFEPETRKPPYFPPRSWTETRQNVTRKCHFGWFGVKTREIAFKGEKQNEPFQFTFNGLLKVEFQRSRVTSDAGLILVRELDERLGLEHLIAEHLADSRQGLNTQFSVADLCASPSTAG